MALIAFEGFDNWGLNNTTTGYSNQLVVAGTKPGWPYVNISSFVAGTLGGKALSMGFNTQAILRFPTVTTESLVVGFRFQLNTFGANTLIHFYDSAANPTDDTSGRQCTLATNASGQLTISRGATLLGTGTAVILAGADYYVEIKINFANSANVEVRVGGSSTPDISLTGVDTSNTANQNVQYLRLVGPSGFNAGIYDDLYVLDTSGSAPYNDFLGVCRVETLLASSNNSVQWTPNASTNFSRVNETAVDSDTTYNSDSTAGHIDTFNHGSLAGAPATIFAVKTQSVARKEDVSAKTFRNKLISGSTTVSGTTYDLSTVYQTYEDYYIADPNTAAAWANATAVNGTKNGYENVS